MLRGDCGSCGPDDPPGNLFKSLSVPAFDLSVDVLVAAAIEPQPLASGARDPSRPFRLDAFFPVPDWLKGAAALLIGRVQVLAAQSQSQDSPDLANSGDSAAAQRPQLLLSR